MRVLYTIQIRAHIIIEKRLKRNYNTVQVEKRKCICTGGNCM